MQRAMRLITRSSNVDFEDDGALQKSVYKGPVPEFVERLGKAAI